MVTLKDVVKIAIAEYKDDAEKIADAAFLYERIAKVVEKIKSETLEMHQRHRGEITAMTERLRQAQAECPCPGSAMTYHSDPSGNNDSHHECSICRSQT